MSTLRVLSSSVVIGISGWFRLYIAFLLAGTVPDLMLCFAFSSVVYSVYTLDRGLKSKEDEVNRPEEMNADRNLILLAISGFLITALLILASKKMSPITALLPFMIGFFYAKGLKIGSISVKFKKGLGVKNCVVAFTWAITITAFIQNFTGDNLQNVFIFIFFFIKSFINTVLFDCKDVKGDSMAGLITIPVYLGEKRTRIILQLLNSSFHLILAAFVGAGLVEFETIIILYSWTAGLIYISLYANHKQTVFRSLVVHGEYAHMLAFRYLAIQLSRNAFRYI